MQSTVNCRQKAGQWRQAQVLLSIENIIKIARVVTNRTTHKFHQNYGPEKKRTLKDEPHWAEQYITIIMSRQFQRRHNTVTRFKGAVKTTNQY